MVSLDKEVLSQLGKEEQEIFREIFKDDPIADANKATGITTDADNVDNCSRQCGC